MPSAATSIEWQKSLATCWRWNPHRHEGIIWFSGGLVYMHVCWCYLILRTEGARNAHLPLVALAIEGAAFHFIAACLGIYFWRKVPIFSFMRVIVSNFQYMFIALMIGLWWSSQTVATCSGFVVLTILILRGVLLRSAAAGQIAILSTALILGLAVQTDLIPWDHALDGYIPTNFWMCGIGAAATVYALMCGLDDSSAPKTPQAWAWHLLHVGGAGLIASALMLLLVNHEAGWNVFGFALVACAPAAMYMFGTHVHLAVFLHMAVAAGDLDAV